MTVKKCPGDCIDIAFSVQNAWSVWGCSVPRGHTYEDVCDPEYFGPHKTRYPHSPRPNDAGLRIGDELMLKAQDHSWQARHVITDIIAETNKVIHEKIDFISFEAHDIPRGYEVKDRGAAKGWCIELNGEHIEGGFYNPKAAETRAKSLEESALTHKRVASARKGRHQNARQR